VTRRQCMGRTPDHGQEKGANDKGNTKVWGRHKGS
jgi:hypothetical protein